MVNQRLKRYKFFFSLCKERYVDEIVKEEMIQIGDVLLFVDNKFLYIFKSFIFYI